MKHYHHLGNVRAALHLAGPTGREHAKQIADALGRHPSMPCREIKRNTYAQCHFYTYHWAMKIVLMGDPKIKRLVPGNASILIGMDSNSDLKMRSKIQRF
ncbi:hypothetical protein [Nitrospira sp. M1]